MPFLPCFPLPAHRTRGGLSFFFRRCVLFFIALGLMVLGTWLVTRDQADASPGADRKRPHKAVFFCFSRVSQQYFP